MKTTTKRNGITSDKKFNRPTDREKLVTAFRCMDIKPFEEFLDVRHVQVTLRTYR